MDMKTCYYCGGNIEDGTTTLKKQESGKHIFIEDVPARICTQCGERYFDSRVLQEIEEMMKAGAPIDRTINVPIMKYKVA